MSKEDVSLFFDSMAKDEVLQARFKEANAVILEKHTGDLTKKESLEAIFEEDIIPIVKEAGYDFSYNDLIAYSEGKSEHALNDDELEAVTGGNDVCVCVIAGFGTFGDLGFACAIGGAGESETFACYCVIGGGGGLK